MRTRAAAAIAAAAVFTGLPACSSMYTPQARGRVSIILVNGAPAYVRDGQVIPHGFLGNGLRRAVRGNPGAERAAQQYHDRQRDGLLVGLGGLACSIIAAGVMANDLAEQEQEDGNVDEFPTAGWLSLGCLAASMGGLGYVITAEPYRYDAINIFNDTTPQWMPVAPGMPAAPGAYGPYAAPPPSLRMRD
jgi:hypothetical protein